MLSMCMEWIKKRLYNRRREQLVATFHKNSNNVYLHVVTGLELITEPLEYKSGNYAPISLFGQIESVVPVFGILVDRLRFHLTNFENQLGGGKPREIPDNLSRKNDVVLLRWKDIYFQTTSPDTVRQQLAVIRQLLVQYEHVFIAPASGTEEDVLWRNTQPILRELEVIVEHYL